MKERINTVTSVFANGKEPDREAFAERWAEIINEAGKAERGKADEGGHILPSVQRGQG
ncbi:MAG: hypothetical protein J5854_01090 [Clostridia bacterium]|nr:hypothetical protein [Clostridia bacterium]